MKKLLTFVILALCLAGVVTSCSPKGSSKEEIKTKVKNGEELNADDYDGIITLIDEAINEANDLANNSSEETEELKKRQKELGMEILGYIIVIGDADKKGKLNDSQKERLEKLGKKWEKLEEQNK